MSLDSDPQAYTTFFRSRKVSGVHSQVSLCHRYLHVVKCFPITVIWSFCPRQLDHHFSMQINCRSILSAVCKQSLQTSTPLPKGGGRVDHNLEQQEDRHPSSSWRSVHVCAKCLRQKRVNIGVQYNPCPTLFSTVFDEHCTQTRICFSIDL